MQLAESGIIAPIHEIPNGGLILFDIDGDTRLGIKAIVVAEGDRIGVLTLMDPDVGAPAFSNLSATGGPFLHLQHAVLRPYLEPKTIHVRSGRPTKAGLLLKRHDCLLLTAYYNRSEIGFIDLVTGAFSKSGVPTNGFVFEHWCIVAPYNLQDETIFEFSMPRC